MKGRMIARTTWLAKCLHARLGSLLNKATTTSLLYSPCLEGGGEKKREGSWRLGCAVKSV